MLLCIHEAFALYSSAQMCYKLRITASNARSSIYLKTERLPSFLVGSCLCVEQKVCWRSGKFQESASGDMEAGMADQTAGSCQGQHGAGSGSNTLNGRLSPRQFVRKL